MKKSTSHAEKVQLLLQVIKKKTIVFLVSKIKINCYLTQIRDR